MTDSRKVESDEHLEHLEDLEEAPAKANPSPAPQPVIPEPLASSNTSVEQGSEIDGEKPSQPLVLSSKSVANVARMLKEARTLLDWSVCHGGNLAEIQDIKTVLALQNKIQARTVTVDDEYALRLA